MSAHLTLWDTCQYTSHLHHSSQESPVSGADLVLQNTPATASHGSSTGNRGPRLCDVLTELQLIAFH